MLLHELFTRKWVLRKSSNIVVYREIINTDDYLATSAMHVNCKVNITRQRHGRYI